MENINFKKHVGIIFEDPVKVRRQDKDSHLCSKGKGVIGVRLGLWKKKNAVVWKIRIIFKMLLYNQFQKAALKSYLSAAKQKPQSREIGACSIQLENTGLHQVRANKELDKSQQTSHCFKKQMFALHMTESRRNISRHFSHLKTHLLLPLTGLF